MATKATTTSTPVPEYGLALTVAALAAEVKQLREELARRDMEQVELEGAVEFLLEQESTLKLCVGVLSDQLSARLPGFARDLFGGDTIRRELYPVDRSDGRRQGKAVTWQRPERRWTQFGSLAELRHLAASHGALDYTTTSRRALIRRLWSRQLLPHGVDLHLHRAEADPEHFEVCDCGLAPTSRHLKEHYRAKVLQEEAS